MKIAVAGLWHLGCVTAACLANVNHTVVGYDNNHELISSLNQGCAPIYEPGLNELIAQGITTTKLSFTTDATDLKNVDILWITYDTPVDNNDIADVAYVETQIASLLPNLKSNTLILISSQLPVGTIRKLANLSHEHHAEKNFTYACSPENLRLGKAIDVFTKPDRIIVGIQTDSDKERIQQLLHPFTDNIIWMSIESAEMTKHAINAFLATSVVFINELSTLCERVGADARDVERGLKSEERIGPKSYLRPGAAIAGGTLARDVNYLVQIGKEQHVDTSLFSSLLQSNHTHKQWSSRRLLQILKDLRNKTITALGLTYKPGTDTLRRSTAVEMCEWLKQQGANVVAFDPALKSLPDSLIDIINLKPTLEEALRGSDAVIIATECHEFSSLTADQLLANVNKPLVFDASAFLLKQLGNDQRIKYYSVGRQT